MAVENSFCGPLNSLPILNSTIFQSKSTFSSFVLSNDRISSQRNRHHHSVNASKNQRPSPKHCLCEKGFSASDDRKRCMPLARVASEVPVSLGKYCDNSSQCQSRDPYSHCINNICRCILHNSRCSIHNTGCHKETFQCRNGDCISWYFVCDGYYNCQDGSDEEECILGRCPKEAFQCVNGDCVSRSRLCNGRRDCLDGSDELNCYRNCNTTLTFRCNDGSCLPQYMFCNAVSSCKDKSDENPSTCELGKHCPKEHYQCKNGRCRSTAILCSGKDGCGDNSDETRCKVCYCPKPSLFN